MPETRSVADENESDVKCASKDGAQQGLLTENQYDVGPQSEPSCSSTEPHLIPQVDLSTLSVIRIYLKINPNLRLLG